MTADRAELLELLLLCSRRAHLALAQRELAEAQAWIQSAEALGCQIERLADGVSDAPRR